ncbi:MAG: TetR/AcrR family transcriptional regulator, transcriptional repressor for nem operon [Gammaproteobacteria bacterium]|nr:TetR/AcrR family transcriptional regulator, transcriptional repressor for nem operon [Gammaproteobacteria bacterium]
MDKPIGRKALSHERIVDAASRDLRRSGFHGVAVVDVMKSAGLTHGGFYAHFASREALLAEAVTRASDNAADAIKTQAKNFQGAGLSPFRAFVESYLSASHVEDCENGCPVAALCGEMPSQAGHVADASRHIVGNLRRLVLQFLPSSVPREMAWSVASTLVGAVQLTRALGDTQQGKAVIAAAKRDLLERYDS